MGWEWRVFCKEPLEVWKLLRQRPSLFSGAKRTDLYVLCTDSVSIKFRHGEHLEFKIREKRHESGAELWSKVEFHEVSLQKSSDMKVLQSLVVGKLESIARGYGQDLQSLLTQAVERVRENWQCIEVSKNRQNGRYAGLSVEQTNISLISRGDQWETTCFEGSLECILKFLASSPGKRIVEYGYQVTGYPEFLCKMV